MQAEALASDIKLVSFLLNVTLIRIHIADAVNVSIYSVEW